MGHILREFIADFVHVFRATPHIKSKEPKKVVIHTSFWRALRRCRIHVIPASVTFTILYLTFKNHYIGTTFDGLIESETLNLLLLQVAAKAQELLVVASLATVIFHISRTELLFGGGLPLGLVGSGLLFSNIGYFFSSEFIGSLSYAGNRWRKARLFLLLIVAGLTAALAGPATAVLIVPRKQQVEAGGTNFYIKGGNNDIWPIELDAGAAGNISYCSSSNGTKYSVCPSAGFQSLWSHFGQADFTNFKTASTSAAFSKPLSGTGYYWTISSPLSLFPRVYTLGSPRQDGYSFLIQPHAATAALLQKITTDWWQTLLWTTKRIADSIDDRYAKSITYNPVTQVKCSPPKNVSRTSELVDFPVLNPPGRWGENANFSVDTLSSNASDHLRFHWVHLPNSFGPATIGAVFESAWASDNASRIVIGCSIQAQWFNGTLYSDEYNFWSGWYTWNTRFDQPFPRWEEPKEGETFNSTNGRIAVKDDWLEMLTPPTPQEGPGYFSWKPSTMESILMNTGFAKPLSPDNNSTMALDWDQGDQSGVLRTGLLETIICSVFEDGVSRAGSYLLYHNTSTPDPSQWQLATYNLKLDFNSSILNNKDAFQQPSQPFATLRVEFSITGYAFSSSLASYLSMSVLFVHLIFALGHTVWILSRQKTSDSWNSMSKIIALAQNSKPAYNILPNTGAGIEKLATYGRTAKIRATENADGTGYNHLELIFQGKEGDASENSDEEQNGFELQVPKSSGGHSRGSSSTFTVSAGNSVMAKTSMSSLVRPAGFVLSVGTADIVVDGQKYG